MLRFHTILMALLMMAIPSSINAQIVKPVNLAKVKTTSVPAHAIVLGKQAIAKVSPVHRRYTRFVWVKDYSQENFQAVALTNGYISRATTLQRPEEYPIIGKQLVQIDLQRFAPAEGGKDLEEFVRVWEELQFDPSFNLLLTKGTLKNLILIKSPDFEVVLTFKDWQLVDKDKVFWQNDKQFLGRWDFKYITKKMKLSEIKLDDIDVVRINGEHIPELPFTTLQEETQSAAPVVSYDYFITRALSSIRDKGLYKAVMGGLYYDFTGIRRASSTSTKGTDEDFYYERLGIGSIEAGITAQKIFDRVRSDQRVAMFRSKVTGGWRRFDWFAHLAAREAIPIVMVTHDVRRQDIDVGQHPIMNLVNFQDAAREVIATKANGLYEAALFNNKGALQDVVPPDVASDRTIPAPHHPELQAIISCMRCHNIPEFAMGIQPVQNDVKKILEYFKVYGDLAEQNKLIPDTLDRIKGWFLGDPEPTFMRVRDDLARFHLRATGPWKDGGDQTKIVSLSTQHIAAIYKRYNWDMINQRTALLDLGFDVDEKDAKDLIWMLLPPDVASGDGSIIPEDPRIAALKVGIDINRVDWAFAYPFAAARTQRTIAALPQPQQPVQKKTPAKSSPKANNQIK